MTPCCCRVSADGSGLGAAGCVTPLGYRQLELWTSSRTSQREAWSCCAGALQENGGDEGLFPCPHQAELLAGQGPGRADHRRAALPPTDTPPSPSLQRSGVLPDLRRTLTGWTLSLTWRHGVGGMRSDKMLPLLLCFHSCVLGFFCSLPH